MEKKKKSIWQMLNPLEWIEAALSLLAWLLGPLLKLFGMLPHPSTGGFENISKADVDEAAEDARRTEEAIDAMMNEKSAAQVVKDYANATPEDRALMDLSALDEAGQQWLQSLSADDLTLLSMSTTGGCARSLEARAVKPIYPRPAAEMEEAEILRIPTVEDVEEEKRRLIAERFRQVQRELWLSPGVPNMNPRHVSRTTLH